MLTIFIDADGCAVKDETYRVATRYHLKVFVVANTPITIPMDPNFEMQVVPAGPDVADDWIVEHVTAGDIVVTTDLLLADRCIRLQARVLGPKGEELTEDNIGNALATRELMAHLRTMGQNTGGPSAMTKQNKSQFLSQLDQIIQSLLRQQKLKKP